MFAYYMPFILNSQRNFNFCMNRVLFHLNQYCVVIDLSSNPAVSSFLAHLAQSIISEINSSMFLYGQHII